MNTASNVLILKERSEARNACQSCMRRLHCPVNELGAEQREGQAVRQITTRPGKAIFTAGEEFDGLYIVRSGFFKSSFMDSEGAMQVTGFHFPGEIFGIDGIENGSYSNTVEALDTGSLCRIPFALFAGEDNASERADRHELLARQRMLLALVRVMSKAISRDRGMIFALGKMSARRRFATFLLDVSERMAHSGYDGKDLRLCMSRIDMANYLGLAVETVSRLFTQFQNIGLLRVNRRELHILDMATLRNVAEEDGEDQAAMRKVG